MTTSGNYLFQVGFDMIQVESDLIRYISDGFDNFALESIRFSTYNELTGSIDRARAIRLYRKDSITDLN